MLIEKPKNESGLGFLSDRFIDSLEESEYFIEKSFECDKEKICEEKEDD